MAPRTLNLIIEGWWEYAPGGAAEFVQAVDQGYFRWVSRGQWQPFTSRDWRIHGVVDGKLVLTHTRGARESWQRSREPTL